MIQPEISAEKRYKYEDAIKKIDSKMEKDVKDAINGLKELEKELGKCIGYHLNLGKAKLILGKHEDAKTEFHSIISKESQLDCCCEIEIEDKDKAIAQANRYLGIIYRLDKDYTKAKNYLEAEKSKDKTNDYSLFVSLGILHHEMGKYAEAETEFKNARGALKPNDDCGEDIIKFYLGKTLYKQVRIDEARGNFDEALESFDKQIQQENNENTRDLELYKAAILTNIARLEIHLHSYDVAEEKLKEALSIYERNGKYIEGLANYYKKQEMENRSILHNNLGIIYYNLGLYNKARNEFEQALKYNSKFPEAYNNLANIYAKEKNENVAEKLYQEALRINPKLKKSQDNIELMRDKKGVSWWDWWFNKRPTLKQDDSLDKFVNELSSWKRVVGGILLASLLLIIISVFVPLIPGWGLNQETTTVTTEPILIGSELSLNNTIIDTEKVVSLGSNATSNSTNSTTTETTKTTETTNTKIKNVTTTEKTSPPSTEMKLLFAALIIFMLLHPQIKGFSAGTVKIDLEPSVMSKGAGLELACI